MIATAQALHEFFSQFGIPAYTENNIPKDAKLPYLTYPLKEPSWDKQESFYVNVYYRNDKSEMDCLSKADEITGMIGEGIRLFFRGGMVVLWPGSPLVQTKPPETGVRGAYINLMMNAYHVPGM